MKFTKYVFAAILLLTVNITVAAADRSGFEDFKEQFTVNWKEPDTTNLTSTGINLIWKGVAPHGIAIHVQDEFQVIPHIGIKGNIEEQLFFDNLFSDLCLATSFAGWLEFFPMSNQLRKFYLGFGGAIDYFAFMNGFFKFTDDTGWVLSFNPYVGYRFTLPFYFMLDVYVGYKFPYEVNCNLSGLSEKFLGAGWQVGIKLTRTWSFSKALKADREAKKAKKEAAKQETEAQEL